MDPQRQRLYKQFVEGTGVCSQYQDETIAGFYATPTYLDACMDALLNLITISPQEVIVEIGCGKGTSTRKIRARNPAKIIAIDPSGPMLRHAQEAFQDDATIECKLGSAEELSRVVERAEKVISINVFRYFEHPENALQEIYRVLNPDGIYLFNVPVMTAQEEAVYTPLYKTLEAVLSEELGKEITLPEMKGVEPKYRKEDMEALAASNGFIVAQYEEMDITCNEETMHAIHERSVAMAKLMWQGSFTEEQIERMVPKLQERLRQFREGQKGKEFFVGRMALVCLKKTQREG
ncbi:class I SAM-dependent methyltransferase [Candidatus Woesearchaeota archaeon]|nr:class I SAM-dependent methyltransferase [Candidatus Woesearchaeota archaeon]